MVVRRQVDDPERELARLEAALTATRAEITRLRHDVARKLNESEAAIFDAHLLVLEDVALIGPREKIRDDLAMWEESAVTTMIVSGGPKQLRDIAEIVLG